MYNWMKWLRLLGGWHFIAATAIKPPKAACQFAADDILLYKICYNIQWIYFTIWEKGKEELSPLQYHFKSLHIISRHYKKSLLRSQIYHGYEELSTDTNYPIWRQKLPYMKKTRKKKQVCGAACFMAAEIKFSEDVRHQVCPRDNSSPVQARITKFGPKMQNTLVKVPIVFGGNQPWPSRSNLRSKSKFTPFWAYPHHNSSPIQATWARITKFGPEVQNTKIKIPIVLGGNWPWPSRSNLT